MKAGWLGLVVAIAWLAPLSVPQFAEAHDPLAVSGDGSVRISRLPFLDGTARELTTGWLGGSHVGQYATDWGGQFQVHAASEGSAICGFYSGWGNRVDLTKINGIVEYYAHLASCPWSSNHLEQGDALATSDNTGCDTPPDPCLNHLHYEVIGTTSDSQRCISQFCSLYHSTWHHHPHHTFTSDNAGPGQGAGNAYIGAGMALTYRNVGHLLCGLNKAWVCMGSSHAFFSGTEKATGTLQGGDWGWHQQFYQPSEPDGLRRHRLWVPHANFMAWLNNSWLGQPRSSYAQSGQYWVQYFRHGIMIAPSFGAPPWDPIPGEYTSCYP